jgi:hypothetical protein
MQTISELYTSRIDQWLALMVKGFARKNRADEMASDWQQSAAITALLAIDEWLQGSRRTRLEVRVRGRVMDELVRLLKLHRDDARHLRLIDEDPVDEIEGNTALGYDAAQPSDATLLRKIPHSIVAPPDIATRFGEEGAGLSHYAKKRLRALVRHNRGIVEGIGEIQLDALAGVFRKTLTRGKMSSTPVYGPTGKFHPKPPPLWRARLQAGERAARRVELAISRQHEAMDRANNTLRPWERLGIPFEEWRNGLWEKLQPPAPTK